MKENIIYIPIDELYPFADNPYKLRDDTELQESVREYGVFSPLIVRPREQGGYEIISGHRRKAACEEAGIKTVPAFVCELDYESAVIALVDSNLHREHILPSEKANAYKLKLDAIKQRGDRNDLNAIKRGQVVQSSRDAVSDTESGRQVQRYIRLTKLIPEILQMVDEGKIAFSPAIELSYLPKETQVDLLETKQSEDRTPSYSQSWRMRQLSDRGQLDIDGIFDILTEEKANQIEKLKIKTESIRGFFPKGYTINQMEKKIFELLGDWQQKRERAAMFRDSR